MRIFISLALVCVLWCSALTASTPKQDTVAVPAKATVFAPALPVLNIAAIAAAEKTKPQLQASASCPSDRYGWVSLFGAFGGIIYVWMMIQDGASGSCSYY